MYRIRKQFRFEAAHQLDRAFTKECAQTIHGHSYRVEVFLTSTCLDGNMMVVDFGALAEAIQAIKNDCDHALLISAKKAAEYNGPLPGKVWYLGCSPTAEVLAAIFFERLQFAIKTQLNQANGPVLERVRVHETEDGWAEYA
jgi:6-pyruvoyltetrahydropterin/6-carboxytetrahydropterin synthase